MRLNRAVLAVSEEVRRKRRRYFSATLVTCGALLALGISIHLIQMLDLGIAKMRSKATYNLEHEEKRIRAAGEDAYLHRLHEAGDLQVGTIEVEEIRALLSKAQWAEVELMIDIPAGKFLMGSNRKLSDPQDMPQHSVELPAYQISKYPISNAQYALFVKDTDHLAPSNWVDGVLDKARPLHPVTMVSFFDAKAYCTWVGGRVPTEPEWEKAARGTDGRRWPWGNRMDNSRLNTYYNVGSTNQVFRYNNGVSPYGVYDMAGNVAEWTSGEFKAYEGSTAKPDLFKAKVPRATSAADAAMKVIDLVTVNSTYLVMRGGSWKSDPFSTASYHRNYSFPHHASDFYGFRCVKDVIN